MNEENTEQQEAQQNPEENSNSENEVDDTTENEGELTPEQIEDLKKKSEVSSQNFERAKKAEKERDDLKKKLEGQQGNVKEITAEQMTAKDFLALSENKVSSQDFDEIVRVSKILGKPVSEALQDQTLKTILQTRQEERKTAEASHTKGGARGSSKKDGEILLQHFEKTGEIPGNDDDLRRMQEARLVRKRRK